MDIANLAQKFSVISNCEKIQWCLYLYPRLVVGVYHRHAKGIAISGVGVWDWGMGGISLLVLRGTVEKRVR